MLDANSGSGHWPAARDEHPSHFCRTFSRRVRYWVTCGRRCRRNRPTPGRSGDRHRQRHSQRYRCHLTWMSAACISAAEPGPDGGRSAPTDHQYQAMEMNFNEGGLGGVLSEEHPWPVAAADRASEGGRTAVGRTAGAGRRRRILTWSIRTRRISSARGCRPISGLTAVAQANTPENIGGSCIPVTKPGAQTVRCWAIWETVTGRRLEVIASWAAAANGLCQFCGPAGGR
jgi:hypothetical protein